MDDHLIFTTEIHQQRPLTSQKVTPTPDSIYYVLKKTKDEARKAQEQLTRSICTHHKVKRSLDSTNHKSLIKRIEFLKIYHNKKAMYNQRQLLDNKKIQNQRFMRKSIDTVKRRKLESELHHILMQNEDEDHISQMQLTNKKQKQKYNFELMQAKRRAQTLRHHDQIKKKNNQFMIRKKNMHTSLTMRSKHNYQQKKQQELQLIQQYESLMGQIEQQFVSKQTEDFTKTTISPTHYTFVTSKNTIE